MQLMLIKWAIFLLLDRRSGIGLRLPGSSSQVTKHLEM